ncbi:MAG: hypothetical protein E6Q66_09870 [Pedobacter sp.]|jgi:hypothetical protein|nr:MAG: hypothetical protein E6Q66_09870 [Pedobacter sp.]
MEVLLLLTQHDQTMKQLILSSKKLQGSLTLVYENGVLKSFVNEFKKPLNAIQEAGIKRVLQFNFDQFNALDYAAIGLDLVSTESTGESSNGGQRVALFCQEYKQKYGNNYLVSKKDGALLKQLSLPNKDDFEKIVVAYFDCAEWWASPKNIGGLISRINELRQWMSAPQKDASAKWHFPDGYSKTREQECKTNEEIQAYWKHLRAQGYQKTRVGIVETWKKLSIESE